MLIVVNLQPLFFRTLTNCAKVQPWTFVHQHFELDLGVVLSFVILCLKVFKPRWYRRESFSELFYVLTANICWNYIFHGNICIILWSSSISTLQKMTNILPVLWRKEKIAKYYEENWTSYKLLCERCSYDKRASYSEDLLSRWIPGFSHKSCKNIK